MDPSCVARLIESGIPGAVVQVRSDDNVHFQASVVATAFASKNTLARHRMVYAALGSAMGDEIHALSLRTATPDEQA